MFRVLKFSITDTSVETMEAALEDAVEELEEVADAKGYVALSHTVTGDGYVLFVLESNE